MTDHELTPIFEDNCYDLILSVRPFGEPMPDWLMVEAEDRRDPETPQSLGSNALPPSQVEALRDALTAWLDEHPVKPDPFANGGVVEWTIDGETFYVSQIGG